MSNRERDRILDEINALIDDYDALLEVYAESAKIDQLLLSASDGSASRRRERDGRTLMVRAEAAIERNAPNKTYGANAKRAWDFHGGVENQLHIMMGALSALRDDIQADALSSLRELLSVNTFSDFLDMAMELLEKHYKDAAAVIAGTVHEQHLRRLAQKNGIVTSRGGRPMKASALNDHLAKKEIYSKSIQKQITANLGIRNDAAHGDYDRYNASAVKALINSVGDFIDDFPA